ncbi:hypothetical protein N431DRAFT_483460 [Stipitochalara longipes BDJ]|nr:hypothetical protein N431DRAFT_483460 [Stipitochalara longipes BDJ]
MEPEMTPATGRKIDTESGPFPCKICSKTFTNRPSRNRHVLYCRKKLGDNLPVLRKSCAACRKAKVKCDSEFPRCRRCTEKDLVCTYELTQRSNSLAQQPASTPSNQPKSNHKLLVEAPQLGHQNEIPWNATLEDHSETLIGSDVHSSGAWPTDVSDFSYQNEFSLDWEPNAGFVEDLEVSHFVSSSTSDYYLNGESSFNWLSGPSPSLTLGSTFSTPADCMFHTPYLVIRPMDRDYPPPPSAVISSRSPFIHSHLSTGSQIGRTFLMQSMQSYATLLAAPTLPPFIHTFSLPAYGPSPPSSAPLEICKSIVSLYKNKTSSTSPFIWRSVTTEKDCFMKELENSDDWTMLSMLQAITVYILLRIFDENSFSVEFDRALTAAMTEIAIAAEQRQLLCRAEIEGWRPEWKEWVLLESKRRTVTLLFIFHLLFDIKPEQRAKSHVGLSVLPLPAHKQLWQASGEEEWRQAYDEMLKARDGRSYLRYEDLIALRNGRGGERMKDLNAWMVGGDSFGMLVMMAATTL